MIEYNSGCGMKGYGTRPRAELSGSDAEDSRVVPAHDAWQAAGNAMQSEELGICVSLHTSAERSITI
jgi:hypothetical protein